MKSRLEWLVVFFVLNIFILSANAEEPNIPANAWEQHPEGIALALMLTSHPENGVQTNYLILYVKNTSNTSKQLVSPSNGAIFFYVDASGTVVTLGNHDHPDHPEKDDLESNMRWRVILPGGIVHPGTEITADEVALAKANAVKCKILIADGSTGQGFAITGSPRLLTSTP